MPRSALAHDIADVTTPFDPAEVWRVAVEGGTSAIMAVDRDLVITYVNDATHKLFSDHAEAFRAAYPRIDFDRVEGSKIDIFHRNPSVQQRMLTAPRAEAHIAEISVGDLRFSLHITSILDAAGVYVGNVMEWANVTELRRYEGMIAAISKAQSMVEFSMDGVIQDANDTFLTAMVYTLDEVRGQHHSLFVPPEERMGHEYRAFWDKLSRGQYDTGQYRRFGKGGREVWIQASYNPIIDRSGKPFKVVEFATDITAQRLATANFEGQIAAINKAQAVIEFGIDGIVTDANENFLKVMGYTLAEVKGQHHSLFVDPEHRSSAEYRTFWDQLGRGQYDTGQYKRIGKGNRVVWLQASYNPILDLNGKPFKVVKYATDITDQRGIAERVKEISNIVASAATEMQATAETLAAAADEATRQASSVALAAEAASMNVQTVAAAGEELSTSIAEISRQVTDSTTISQQAVAETDKTRASIQTLAEAAQKIGNVVTLINNIAGQTKLLALNATIEAARAGDAGKGFAVVASEVKSLSDQTAKATHEISSQVSAMQAATETSVHAIQGIADTIRKVAEIAAAIASAVEEQSAATREISANVAQAAEGTQQVSSNIASVSAVAGQTNTASGELLVSSGEMARQAEALSSEMDKLLSA
jgi:methyl-accepting chemotaxis protein